MPKHNFTVQTKSKTSKHFFYILDQKINISLKKKKIADLCPRTRKSIKRFREIAFTILTYLFSLKKKAERIEEKKKKEFLRVFTTRNHH